VVRLLVRFIPDFAKSGKTGMNRRLQKLLIAIEYKKNEDQKKQRATPKCYT
jgi:hypothetical protein